MKKQYILQSALLLSIYLVTVACVILLIRPSIRNPRDAKGENKTKQKKAVIHEFSTHSAETEA